MTKEQLKKYRDLKKERDDLARKIRELEDEMYGPRALRLDGMPRSGSGVSYVTEERIDNKNELLTLYIGQQVELNKALLAIEQSLQKLESRERRLIRLHYIDGLTWEQVAVEMDYSWRQVHRIHSDALEKLREEEKASV